MGPPERKAGWSNCTIVASDNLPVPFPNQWIRSCWLPTELFPPYSRGHDLERVVGKTMQAATESRDFALPIYDRGFGGAPGTKSCSSTEWYRRQPMARVFLSKVVVQRVVVTIRVPKSYTSNDDLIVSNLACSQNMQQCATNLGII